MRLTRQPQRAINLPEALDAAIVACAARQGTNPHAWIRQAIDEKLERETDAVIAALAKAKGVTP